MDFSKLGDMEGHYDGEENIHFYYDREERIAKSPKIVQDYYSGKFHPTGGLFKSLVSTRGNKLLLLCVVVCAAAVVLLHRFGDTPYRKHIGNAQMTAQAFSYGDDVYVSLVAKGDDAKANSTKAERATAGKLNRRGVPDMGGEGSASDGGLVEGVFTAVDIQGDSVAGYSTRDIMVDGKAELKAKFGDYDIKKVLVQVSYNGETKTLVAEVGERR